MKMRPIPETATANDLYGPFLGAEGDLVDYFVEVSAAVRAVVPECVGISVSLREHGVTLTLVATEERIALLDAVQYADDGPCVDAMAEGRVVDAGDRLSLDDRWHLFAEATRRSGIESTLSLPVPWEGAAALGFNLYASEPGAFDGHHDELAELLGAWADGALVNADLTFASRRTARRASEMLREATDVAMVSVLLARARGLEVEEAEQRLRDAADRAAIPLADLLDLMRDVLPQV